MLYVNFIVLWIDVLVVRNSSACAALYYFVSFLLFCACVATDCCCCFAKMQVVCIDVHMHSPVHGSSGLRDMLINSRALFSLPSS